MVVGGDAGGEAGERLLQTSDGKPSPPAGAQRLLVGKGEGRSPYTDAARLMKERGARPPHARTGRGKREGTAPRRSFRRSP